VNLDYIPDAASASFEKDHWWVRSRFGLLDRALGLLDPKASLAILEVGCGTGINLDYLETRCGPRLASLIGVDPQANPGGQGRRRIQRELPSGELFDLILLMDVLEHVADPVALLSQLRAQLKPSGHLLVTVPAFSWLWTSFDQLAHHRKRYAFDELAAELRAAHCLIEENFFFFGMLFPFFVMQRLTLKWWPRGDARVFKPVPHWLNRLLYAMTRLELATWMPYNKYAGSTIVAIARI